MTSKGTPRLARIRLVLSLVAVVGAAGAIVAVATAAGSEKTTFGKDGVASQSLGVHYEETGLSNLAAQADGGLVVEQGSLNQGDRLEHYLPDGATDPANPPTKIAGNAEVFPATDGKTFIVQGSKLGRVNANGTPDTSFGGTGTIKAPYEPQAVGELASGKIVAISTEVGGTNTLVASVTVTLLNQDGSPAGGFLKFVPPIDGGIEVLDIDPTGDGGALIVTDSFLLELGADGSANPSFGTEGLVTKVPAVVGAHILPDGSIEAVGTTLTSGQHEDFVLVRYTAAGQPETAFGPGGIRRFDLGRLDEAKTALWATDGSLIAGGHAMSGGPCREEECGEVPILAAFDSAGNLEPGFGKGGVLKLKDLAGAQRGYSSEGVTSLTRRPDGSIVAAGDAPPNRTVGFLAAFSPQGALLRSFGEGGIVRVREPVLASQQISDLFPLPNGKLLAAGLSDVGIKERQVLIRYRADGSLDRSFGNGTGYVIIGNTYSQTEFAVRGDEALAGLYGSPRSHLLLLRTGDAKAVESFGSDGSVALPRKVQVSALAFAHDGDPVVLGYRSIGDGVTEPRVVLRFRRDGRPDKAFGHAGKLPLELPGGGEVEGTALLAVPGERMLIAGSIGHRFAITSLLPDGRPDPRFGSGGWSLVNVGRSADYLMLSRDGSHIYLAGIVGGKEDQHVVLMRFDGDGRLDTSFGRRGRLVAPLKRPAYPTKILPTRKGVLVVLSGGPQPLLTFTKDGKVRSRRVGNHHGFVNSVQATVSRGHLIFGWNTFSQVIKREIFYLARRPLDR